jgi:hypothetical protein
VGGVAAGRGRRKEYKGRFRVYILRVEVIMGLSKMF